MKIFQVSTEKLTCKVGVEDNRIVKAAPILIKFTGQRWNKLIRWLLRRGKLRVVELDNGDWIEFEKDEQYHLMENQ